LFKSKFFKVSALLTMGALLFGVAGAALPALAAEDSTTGDAACVWQQRGDRGAGKDFAGHRGGMMGAGLDQALENGKISQEQYDGMKAVQEKMAELKGDFADLAPEARHAAMKEARTEILDGLLADGTISQDIYDKMIAGPADKGFDGKKTGFGGRGLGIK